MYSIYADGICVYNDVFAVENMKAVNPKLTLEDNTAGSLSLTLTPENAGFSSITRLVTDVSVLKDGQEIWAGRVLSEKKDFYNNRVLYCEGELAFFNDSIQPPAAYPGITIHSFLEAMISVHNSKVAENRQFALGVVTVQDTSYPTFYTNYENTMKLISDLVKKYGGHLRVRKEGGVRYLDYLSDYPGTCNQVIEFGKNLIDFTRQWDLTDFATVIVPLGKRLDDSPIEELDAYLTVASVNSGSIYVQSPEAVAAYGLIEKTVNWDDVDDPTVLLSKANAYLTELQFDNMVLELSALDLHYLDVDYDTVNLLDEIRVVSRPHGLDRIFPVTKLEIPLDSPEKTQFKLGTTVQTSLTGSTNQTNTSIMQKIENLPKAHTLLKEAKEHADSIMHMATTGYITITKDEFGSDTLYISNVRDYTAANKLWRWNMNGLGYSSDGGETFPLAMTMDGSIVADFITSGVMNADVIRAGIIRDVAGRNYWNLNTGEFRLASTLYDVQEYLVDSFGNEILDSFNGRIQTSSLGMTIDQIITQYDTGLDRYELFNKLTDNGQTQGIFYLQNGEMYINATYIATGELADIGRNTVLNLSTGELVMKKGGIYLGQYSSSDRHFQFEVDDTGKMYAGNSAIFAGTLNAAKGSFGGVVQAEDFLDSHGNSMLDTLGRFKSGYLDLDALNLRIDNETGSLSTRIDMVPGQIMAVVSSQYVSNDGLNQRLSTSVTLNSNGVLISNATGRKFTINTAENISMSFSNLTDAQTKQLEITAANNAASAAQSTANNAATTASAAQTTANAVDVALTAMKQNIGYTYIDGQYVISPNIVGARVYGGRFYDDDGGAYFEIGDSGYGDFTVHSSGGARTFQVYDGVGYVEFKTYGDTWLIYNGSLERAAPQGTWAFTGSTTRLVVKYGSSLPQSGVTGEVFFKI